MAQSQLLNVHYLRLQPESELSSPEPFHSSRPSLCCSATNTALCTTGASKRGSEPSKSHPVRPRDGGLTSQGMPVPDPGPPPRQERAEVGKGMRLGSQGLSQVHLKSHS